MTDVEAANKALIMLGVNPISSLTAGTINARTMNSLMPSSKLAVLSDFPWSFALKMQTLTPDATLTPAEGFSVAFLVPSDCENIIQLYTMHRVAEGSRSMTALSKHDYVVTGTTISANIEQVAIEYVWNNTVLATWNDDAQDALVLRLAADAASTLTGGQATAQGLLQKYDFFMGRARAHSAARESFSTPYPVTGSHYIDSRW